MFKNYLKVTFRNLARNKTFVVINVLGLGLALALCVVAYLNYQFAIGFDTNHKNIDEIYKISAKRQLKERMVDYGITPVSMGPAIELDISGADQVTRFMTSRYSMRHDDEVFNTQFGFGDEAYLDIFTYPLIEGDKEAIKDPSKILITKKTAEKYFGEREALGEIMVIRNNSGQEFEFIVAGVMENPPLNTCMQFEALLNYENFIKISEIEDPQDWQRFTSATFLRISDPTKRQVVENLLAKYVPIQNEARQDIPMHSFYLQPLEAVADEADNMWNYWLWNNMHPAAVVAPNVMAILILLIACFNFTNTSIAFSSKRLKEIGVRKVLGGNKSQVVWQFLGENMMLCFMALLFGLLLAYYLVPLYSGMWEYLDLRISFLDNIGFYVFLVALLMFTGLVAGIYPAFYISGFQPVKILSNSLKIKGSSALSKVLLTAQFTISIVALVSGIVFTQNAVFQENMDLGYQKDGIIAVPVRSTAEYTAFRNAVEQSSHIKSIAGSDEHIGWSDYGRTVKSEDKEVRADVLDIGTDYLETMGLNLKEGRNFDIERQENDSRESIIVTELFAQEFGWENPIGKRVSLNDTTHLNIIGLVENFYGDYFFSPIEPTMLRLAKPERLRMVVVSTDMDKLYETNDYLQAEWKKAIPYAPYPGFMQEDTLKEAKDVNKNIIYIFLFLSVIAIILSAIGLFTLVSLNIISRIKELGIRKVLGATIGHLAGLINKQFVIILIIASFFGAIAGYYLTDMLMGSIYAVHIDMNIVSFIVPVIVTFVLAAITIGGKVYNAAAQNPVESLRYE
ncbi:ABC transporter permease [Fulvivirgaceae bacterium BMA10]|uniref:ABC transporter permease n=1 Tax=Splendidivirga corallicola TaxID=3051826 RepID=A0ABT8KKS7_9BACT|nr:ABC transporter permease [Fulvivirgaceae bacterium BMA10]